MRITLSLGFTLGIIFSLPDTLTESQKVTARLLGITDDEMVSRLRRINNLETPEISIIIPVYNGEKYIQKAINSAKAQNYDSFEIIIVNDGSTDKTHDILCGIEGIIYLIKPNGGTASALNCGIRNAKGQWIKWLSADDELYPNALKDMMSLASDKNTIYYTNYHIINEISNIIGEFIEPGHESKELWSFFFGNGSSSLIHRDVFSKCGVFDETLGHSEDYEFWLRATHVYGIQMKLIPTFTLKYRRHPDQLTNKVGGSLDSLIKNKVKKLCEVATGAGKPTI